MFVSDPRTPPKATLGLGPGTCVPLAVHRCLAIGSNSVVVGVHDTDGALPYALKVVPLVLGAERAAANLGMLRGRGLTPGEGWLPPELFLCDNSDLFLWRADAGEREFCTKKKICDVRYTIASHARGV